MEEEPAVAAEIEFVRPSLDVVKSWLGNVELEDESDEEQLSSTYIVGRGGIGASSAVATRQEHQLAHRIVKRKRQEVVDMDPDEDDLTDEEACSRIQNVVVNRTQRPVSAHQKCLLAAQAQQQSKKKKKRRRRHNSNKEAHVS